MMKRIPTQEEINRMPEKLYVPPVSWNDEEGIAWRAKALKAAAEDLLQGNPGDLLAAGALSTRAANLSVKVAPKPYKAGSLQPPDFCYNFINKDKSIFKLHLFLKKDGGLFKFLGPGYPHSGPVLWRPSGESAELVVGEWRNGQCYLRFDPRGGTA